MAYTIQVPKILSASISPNPSIFNTEVLVLVQVTEETVTLEPAALPSGIFYAGEVW